MASKKNLLIKISLGFILGMVFGFAFGKELMDKTHTMGIYFMPVIDVVGRLFLRLLQMLIIPLVFSSLLSGTASLGDVRTLGRIGGKTLFWFAFTTVFAVMLGIFITNFVVPGESLRDRDRSGLAYTPGQSKPLQEVFMGMVPGEPQRPTSFMTGASIVPGETKITTKVKKDVDGEEKEVEETTTLPFRLQTSNAGIPFNAMTAIGEGIMLQIIVFAMLLGAAAAMIGEKAKPFVDWSNGLSETMYGVTDIVLKFAPYGVFALIAQTAARYGIDILMPFVKVIGCLYAGVIIHALVVYSGVIALVAHKSPLWFFRGVAETAVTAFVSRSSSGTLPVTIRNARQNLGVPSNIASFVLPLGATVNMNGTSLYEGVAALFVAQVYGMELTVAQQITIVTTASLAAVGAAGVPGAGLIMLTMVLASVGLPLEGVALIAGIDVVLDMARTTINVVGDQCVAVVVAKSEGLLHSEVMEEGE